MMGLIAEKFVWFFITLFPVFISITQFFDFWVMSYENWKHILGVFNFHNSVSNDILVIKYTWRDPLVRVSCNFWPFFFSFSFFSTFLSSPLFFSCSFFFSFLFFFFLSLLSIHSSFFFCSSSHNIFGLRSVLSFFFFFSSFIGLHWLRFLFIYLFFFFHWVRFVLVLGVEGKKKKKTAPSYRYGAHK